MPSAPPRSDNEATATYANKDGSKFITVRKSSADPATTPTDQPQSLSTARPEMAPGTKAAMASHKPAKRVVNGVAGDNAENNDAPPAAAAAAVNRKKQKRREKQAARLAAEQQKTSAPLDGHPANGHFRPSRDDYHLSPAPLAPQHYIDQDFDDQDQFEPADGDDLYYSDDEGHVYQASYGPGDVPSMGNQLPTFLSGPDTTSKKPKKKRKAKNASAAMPPDPSTGVRGNASALPAPPPPPPPPLSTSATRPAHSISRDRIWNTSTQEERERIKEFWLSLGEEERRSLVKVEKEAVLRKMKEQQKHSCSCTVCGRKRTAIEEELEVLYDAYYEELEQYANHQQTRIEDGVPTLPPPRRYGPMRGLDRPDRLSAMANLQPPSKARIDELADDDDGEEDYSDEDDDEDYSDDYPDEEQQGPAADFFNFGNSLTVQGGILTVADDLLKNDGKKFIEMMEQLAERRMQREEEAQYVASGLAHPSMNMHGHAGHNHPPQPEDDEYDEDEEDDYDSQEDDEYDDDEMDAMTEEQRMEEGRRMFQIFAARMFEQRVLTAYREKVAQERQRKLLEELEEENRLDAQREQKKAKEAQKKKDKKRLQKQAKDEEKARKDAEKAAEEAAARAVEEKKAEELRLKKEGQRKKREAEKKAQEDERLKKEAEKMRRLQEERERQAEVERRQREQKEQEKRKREDAKRKEREEREAKEKEAREKKEREDKERRERAQKAKQEKEAKDRAKRDEQQAAQAAKRSSQAPQLSAPPGLPPSQHPLGIQSPHLPITTPAIPKAPTPMRPRQASQQGSVASSPKTPQIMAGQSQTISPVSAVPPLNSPGPIGPPGKASGHAPSQQPPVPSTMAPPPGMAPQPAPGFPGMPPMGTNGTSSSQPHMMPSMSHRGPLSHDLPPFAQQQAALTNQGRVFSAPNAPPFHPGVGSMAQAGGNAPRTASVGRGVFSDEAPVQSQQVSKAPIGGSSATTTFNLPRTTMPSHSRQQSASYDQQTFDIPVAASQTQPIARPNPIQRPKGEEEHRPTGFDIDDLSSHLGSSALLDDADDQFPSDALGNRRGSAAPGPVAPGPTRSRFNFGPSSMFAHSMGQGKEGLDNGGAAGDSWGAPHMPFGASGMPGSSTWSNNPGGAGWPNASAFGFGGGHNRLTLSRPVNVRLLICEACKQLTTSRGNGDGFHDVSAVLRQVDQIRPASEAQVQMREMLDICETEGDSQNGGGFFTIKSEGPGRTLVKHEIEGSTPLSARGGMAPGEIGSPLSGSMPAFSGTRPFQPASGIPAPSGF